MERLAIKQRSVFLPAVLISLGLLGLPSASAADLETLLRTQVALANVDATAPVRRPGLRAAETGGGQVSPAESAQTAPVEAGSAEDTILAAFGLSVPRSVEEEVALEHKLQLLDRTEVPLVGLRIVRYRVPDGRPIATVISSLLRDWRVSKAQASVQYHRPSQGAPPAQVSGLAERPVPLAKGTRDDRARARRHPDRKTALVQEAQKTPGEQLGMAGVDATGRVVEWRRVKEERPVASAAALRWPSADEPFVNVGGSKR